MAFVHKATLKIAGVNGGQTAATDTANDAVKLITAFVTRYKNGGPITFSDSAGNSWNPATEVAGDSNSLLSRWYYCINPVTASLHKFTTAGSNIVSGLIVQTWTGDSTFDKQTSHGETTHPTGVQNIQPGSLTPAEDNELLLAGYGLGLVGGSPVSSIVDPSGFTVDDNIVGNSGVNYGTNTYYQIQTTGTARNPQLSWTSFVEATANMIAFKLGAAPVETITVDKWFNQTSVPKRGVIDVASY